MVVLLVHQSNFGSHRSHDKIMSGKIILSQSFLIKI
jgi:hypothetical protein